MGIWFTKPEPQFEQRMPWVTSEIIHDDHFKGNERIRVQLENEFAFRDSEYSSDERVSLVKRQIQQWC